MRRAEISYENHGQRQSIESGARALAPMLRAWAEQVEAGVIDIVGTLERAEIEAVSTDVMGQVRRLLEDRDSHPAAAIMLCGAALEVALRAAVEVHGLEVAERHSIMAFARRLAGDKLLNKQDKQIFSRVA